MPEPVSLSELKNWARVDHDADDDLLASLGVAAREYRRAPPPGVIVRPGQTVPARAKVAIKSLSAFWYENRGDTNVEPPAHVRRLIHQLRNWAERRRGRGGMSREPWKGERLGNLRETHRAGGAGRGHHASRHRPARIPGVPDPA
jgi:hypothetical protein